MKWLKSCNHEAPVQGANAKRVKFADVHQELQKQFAPVEVTAKAASQLLSKVHFLALRTNCVENHNKSISGIQVIPA